MKNLFLILALAGLTVGVSAAPEKAAKAPKAGKAGKLATVDSVRVAEARQNEFYERVEIPTPAGEGVALTDAWLPTEVSGKAALSRTLKVTGAKAVVIVLSRDLAVSGPSDGVSEIAGGLLVRAVSGPAPKANAVDKSLIVTIKPGETAVLGYSFR